MSTTYAITFGDRLRRTRLNLGLDQRQLADALGTELPMAAGM